MPIYSENKITYLKVGLLLLIILTSVFVFINNILLGLLAFCFSIAVLILSIIFNKKIVYKKLFFTILFINTIYMIAGNILFSPKLEAYHSIKFFIFNINKLGLENGVIGALKRNAMIIISFAWLSSIKGMEEIYQSLNIIPNKRYKKYLLIFLKHIINQKTKLQTQFYSISIRGIIKKTSNLRTKIFQANLLTKSLFNRFFYDIGKLAYAGECHFINNFQESNSSPKILLKNVTVFYNGEKESIINGIDLEISEKSFICICGNNKAGKTTLLRVISGYIPNISGSLFGSVSICDVQFSNNLEIQDISNFVKYIMDEADDYLIGLTVRQEIMLHCNDTNYAHFCLKMMKIDHLWDQETSLLSGGEKVRLVLASLLASKVKIILLDSVLSQLDETGKSEFIDSLSTFYNNNNCIIIVSDYYIEYYLKLANRYVFLNRGKKVYDNKISFNNYEEFKSCFSKYDDFPKVEIPTFNKSIKNNLPIIQLKNINVKFGERLILNKFNLSIVPSDYIIITGPNGSGKTTAMLTLAGILIPNSGERIVNINPFNLGFVFQNTNFQIVGSTIKEELSIGPLLKKWTEERIDSFLQEKQNYISADLNDSTITLHPVDLKFLAYSSCDIDLNLIIFDEPTICMDNNDLNKFFLILHRLHNNGIAIIIISHDKRLIRSSKQVISF